METLATRVMNDIIWNGGIMRRRHQVLAEYNDIGVTGPAMLRIMDKEAVPEAEAMNYPKFYRGWE